MNPQNRAELNVSETIKHTPQISINTTIHKKHLLYEEKKIFFQRQPKQNSNSYLEFNVV